MAAIDMRTAVRDDSSGTYVLAAATGLGFMLLTAVFGWFMAEVSQLRSDLLQRSDLLTAIEANGDRIDALADRVAGLEVSMSERLTRIETLIDERLPPRR